MGKRNNKWHTRCHRNHFAIRNSYGACTQCAKITRRRWEKAHPGRVKQLRRARYLKRTPAQSEQHRQLCRAWREANRAHLRQYNKSPNVILKKRYGWTWTKLLETLRKRDYKCEICAARINTKTRNIDHDDVSGKIRGLLCSKCNIGIGSLQHNPALCLKAAEYLISADTGSKIPMSRIGFNKRRRRMRAMLKLAA